MPHGHSHADQPNYFLDQLSSILVCGAIGVVGILMYRSGMLAIILAPAFWPPVLAGGIVLTLIVCVRAITLWNEAGKLANTHSHHDHASHQHGPDCNHDHDHDHHDHHDHNHAHHHHDHDRSHKHDHDHKHAHHDHSHDHSHGHDHDHGWSPGRYVLLLCPVILFSLNLPNKGFSNSMLGRALGDQNQTLESAGAVVKKEGQILRFNELASAALQRKSREYFQGQTAKLRGMFWPLDGDKEFTLFRLKMTCCAADSIPLKVRIISPEPLSFRTRDWVEIEGTIEFRKVAGKEEWIPVIQLESADKVKSTSPDNNEYEI